MSTMFLLKLWKMGYYFNKDNHCFDPIIETVSDFRLIDGSGNVNYEDLDSDELKTIIMKKDIEIARLKKLTW